MGGEDGAMILQEYEDQMYESDRRESGYQTGEWDDDSIYSTPAQSQERTRGKKQEQTRQRPQQQQQQQTYLTPAPKRERELSKQRDGSRGREHKSKDGKKRKRYHTAEDFDLSVVRTSYNVDRDSVMTDAPVLHSGLTGGMDRMLTGRSGAEYPSPSPDYPDDVPVAQTPASPLKRTRHSQAETRGRQKGMRGKGLLSLVSSGTSTVSTRKSSSSTHNTTTSDDRPPKKHHRHHHRRRDDSERSHHRKVKAIEYHPTIEQQPENSQNQLIIYRSRAELFTSFISKGPESTIGCSMNKALKRYHRDRADQGIGMGRAEEEKELWKSLRLKRNERGEIVLFF
jgi:cell growth-regulating nucleolar protein